MNLIEVFCPECEINYYFKSYKDPNGSPRKMFINSPSAHHSYILRCTYHHCMGIVHKNICTCCNEPNKEKYREIYSENQINLGNNELYKAEIMCPECESNYSFNLFPDPQGSPKKVFVLNPSAHHNYSVVCSYWHNMGVVIENSCTCCNSLFGKKYREITPNMDVNIQKHF
jgi:hypothetical protein